MHDDCCPQFAVNGTNRVFCWLDSGHPGMYHYDRELNIWWHHRAKPAEPSLVPAKPKRPDGPKSGTSRLGR